MEFREKWNFLLFLLQLEKEQRWGIKGEMLDLQYRGEQMPFALKVAAGPF